MAKPGRVVAVEVVKMEPLLISVADAAALTGISRTTAYALIAEGAWKTVSVGTHIRVVLADLQAWVEANKG